ncbi:MAG: hypothetical protein H0X47_17870 [Nitrospirales bacterium]|nr:hypothetical protein [Nitrospirales bacterium]
MIFSISGVRPGSRAILVSVKVAKTMLALVWPFGFPVRFANTGDAQTRTPTQNRGVTKKKRI